MTVQKYFKGYRVQKYDAFEFGAESLATISIVVPRSELENEDEIKLREQSVETISTETHDEVLEEKVETAPESPSEHQQKLIATSGEVEIDLGEYKSPESDQLLELHGFTHAGIELVLSGKQKTHKKYDFKLV